MNRCVSAFGFRIALCAFFFLLFFRQGKAQFTPEETTFSLSRMGKIEHVRALPWQENILCKENAGSGSAAGMHTENAGNGVTSSLLYTDKDFSYKDIAGNLSLPSTGNMFRTGRYRLPSDKDFRNELAESFYKKPKRDTLYEASPGIDPKLLTFAQRNSGAFKRRKKGGMKSPAMATVCSAVVPGFGQIYNGQWYKTPVLYAGVGVLAYFTDMNLKERNVYDREIEVRTDSTATGFNPALADYSLQEILDLRNFYEHNFELCLIIAGAVYLLNLIDAAVYAHLSSFNVTPNLSMSIKPYARTNFALRNAFPLDAGIRVCLTLK